MIKYMVTVSSKMNVYWNEITKAGVITVITQAVLQIKQEWDSYLTVTYFFTHTHSEHYVTGKSVKPCNGDKIIFNWM